MKYMLTVIILILIGLGIYSYIDKRNEVVQTNTDELALESSAPVCGITAEVTEGPYYVSGAPMLVNGNLNYTDLPGSPLKVSGHVYEGTDNSKPLPNTTIDIWQTDTAGSYHPNAHGNVDDFEDDEIALRGTVTTDESGYYEFHTVYPGEYEGRTRHIHIKVRAEHKPELTTQLILSLNGDDVSFDEDTISNGLPSCHLLSLNANTPPTEATFDFRLPE